MAIDKTRRDINRRELEFGNNQIDKALPEYFQEEYPKLVKLLDTYYEHLDSDGNFGFKIKDLPSSRDIAQTAKENLHYLKMNSYLVVTTLKVFLTREQVLNLQTTTIGQRVPSILLKGFLDHSSKKIQRLSMVGILSLI